TNLFHRSVRLAARVGPVRAFLLVDILRPARDAAFSRQSLQRLVIVVSVPRLREHEDFFVRHARAIPAGTIRHAIRLAPDAARADPPPILLKRDSEAKRNK